VRVLGGAGPDALRRLTHGIELEDGPARFEEIVESGGGGANRWYHVVLREGRNREVRRLWEAAGCKVSRLKRVRHGNIFLGPGVRAGQWRDLSVDELSDLVALAGMALPENGSVPFGKAGGDMGSGAKAGQRSGEGRRVSGRRGRTGTPWPKGKK
jgi:23S rRNA pseudouridine2605 synthase